MPCLSFGENSQNRNEKNREKDVMAMQNNNVSIEEFHKEIDLVQACISRMAQNSFMIKGWSFTLVTAFVALTAEKLNLGVLCVIGILI